MAINWDNLNVQETEMPTTARGRTTKPNPLAKFVDQSRESGKALQLPPLPTGDGKPYTTGKGEEKMGADSATEAQRMLRRAAESKGYGIRITTSEPDKRGMVTVYFQVGEKREYKGRKWREENGDSEHGSEEAA